MKKENFFEFISDIDDDLIERSRNYKKKRPCKRIWISAIAACLALCLAVGALMGGNGGVYTGITEQSGFPVVMAEYPAGDVNKAPFYEDMESHGGVSAFYKATLAEMLADIGENNAVYSPSDIYMSLAMLAELTDGESRAQILSLLGVEDMHSLRINAKAVWNLCYSDGDSKSVIASSLWLNSGLNKRYAPKVLADIAEYYYVSSFSGDFRDEEYRDAVKSWVDSQTGGMLSDRTGDWRLDTETVLAVVSATYFKDGWEFVFDKADTKDMTFYKDDGTSVRSPYLCADDTMIQGYWGDNFIAIRKDFENGGSMLFVLPDRGYTTEDLLRDGEFTEFMACPDKWENQEDMLRDIRIPKFDVSGGGDIIASLKNLGVTDVFDANKADFSPLIKDAPVFVGEMVHGARVRINEQGCEAAADTFEGSYLPGGIPPLVKLDRPFIFSVTSENGIPLFTGVVNDPTVS